MKFVLGGGGISRLHGGQLKQPKTSGFSEKFYEHLASASSQIFLCRPDLQRGADRSAQGVQRLGPVILEPIVQTTQFGDHPFYEDCASAV